MEGTCIRVETGRWFGLKGEKRACTSKRSIKNKEHFLLHPKYLSGEREVMERYVHE